MRGHVGGAVQAPPDGGAGPQAESLVRGIGMIVAEFLWMPQAGGRVDFASEHDEQAMTVPVGEQDVIGYLREHGIMLIYDQAAGTLQAGIGEAAKILIRKAS